MAALAAIVGRSTIARMNEMNEHHEAAERVRPESDMDAEAFAVQVARIAVENKAGHVRVLDLRGLSTLADYFVLATGTSNRQMHAVVDRVREYARTVDRAHFKISDTDNGSWILADYVDVIVHLFDEEHRAYYDLDGLWGDAPRVEFAEGEDLGGGGDNDTFT